MITHTSISMMVSPGEVEIGLEENPTTGYRWVLAERSDGVVVVRSRFETQASPPAVGSGGTRIFTLRLDAGRHRVRFRLKRAWEGAAIEGRTIEIGARAAGGS